MTLLKIGTFLNNGEVTNLSFFCVKNRFLFFRKRRKTAFTSRRKYIHPLTLWYDNIVSIGGYYNSEWKVPKLQKSNSKIWLLEIQGCDCVVCLFGPLLESIIADSQEQLNWKLRQANPVRDWGCLEKNDFTSLLHFNNWINT